MHGLLMAPMSKNLKPALLLHKSGLVPASRISLHLEQEPTPPCPRLCPHPHRPVCTARIPEVPLTPSRLLPFVSFCEPPALLLALWSPSEPFQSTPTLQGPDFSLRAFGLQREPQSQRELQRHTSPSALSLPSFSYLYLECILNFFLSPMQFMFHLRDLIFQDPHLLEDTRLNILRSSDPQLLLSLGLQKSASLSLSCARRYPAVPCNSCPDVPARIGEASHLRHCHASLVSRIRVRQASG